MKPISRGLPVLAVTVLLMVAAGVPSSSQEGAVRPPKFDYHVAKLDNGLSVVLSEDHSTPIVHVELWYQVGSKNERPRRTGFAHLFEHLMF